MPNDAPALIREARRSAGLTQAALAAQLEVSVTTVARWEGGAIDPPSSQLLRALAMCGRSITLTPQEVSS